MPLVTLGGNLPVNNDNNGLDDWAGILMNEAADIGLVCVVSLTVNKITEKVHDNTRYPTMQIAWIEPIGRTGQIPDELRRLVVSARTQRTGSEVLPFDPVQADPPAAVEAYSTGPDDDPARAQKAARDARADRRKGKTVAAVPDDEEHAAAAVFRLPDGAA